MGEGKVEGIYCRERERDMKISVVRINVPFRERQLNDNTFISPLDDGRLKRSDDGLRRICSLIQRDMKARNRRSPRQKHSSDPFALGPSILHTLRPPIPSKVSLLAPA